MNSKGTAQRILLLSDSHGHLDEAILRHARAADEIWHAGDIGSLDVLDQLKTCGKVFAVHGNIDDGVMRREAPKDVIEERFGQRIWMTHIGGVAGRLPSSIREGFRLHQPKIFICGHSHILRVGHDSSGVLCMNPGAMGHHGFHHQRTMLRFDLSDQGVQNLAVIELGKRGALKNEDSLTS
ncbi:MAG: metallophosphoesterase family protein [Schleiferiaceae bacterium]|nr:metallophosphoesterase family protein [Schleiferiaceae bacterium]